MLHLNSVDISNWLSFVDTTSSSVSLVLPCQADNSTILRLEVAFVIGQCYSTLNNDKSRRTIIKCHQYPNFLSISMSNEKFFSLIHT